MRWCPTRTSPISTPASQKTFQQITTSKVGYAYDYPDVKPGSALTFLGFRILTIFSYVFLDFGSIFELKMIFFPPPFRRSYFFPLAYIWKSVKISTFLIICSSFWTNFVNKFSFSFPLSPLGHISHPPRGRGRNVYYRPLILLPFWRYSQKMPLSVCVADPNPRNPYHFPCSVLV